MKLSKALAIFIQAVGIMSLVACGSSEDAEPAVVQTLETETETETIATAESAISEEEIHESEMMQLTEKFADNLEDKLGYELIVLYSDNEAEIVAKETDVARVTLLRAHGNDEGYELPEQYKEKEVVLDADGNIATPESADELVAYVTLLEYDDIDQFDQQFKDLGILDENGDFNTDTIKGIADDIEARNLATYDVAE